MVSRASASQSTVETDELVEYLLDVVDVDEVEVEEEVKFEEGFRTSILFFLPKVRQTCLKGSDIDASLDW